MLNCPPLTALAIVLAILQASLSGQTASENRLEVFSWWTSGSESAALDALFNVYKKQDPGVEIINATVAGGGGSAARAVLQTRLAGGNPPDTWQSHPGWELLGQYVDPGYCESLNDIYHGENWDKVLPAKLVQLLTKDGKQWCVLAGVHRGNDLWYNKKVLDKAGIKIGDTISIDEFLADCAKLKAAGVTPLAVGDSGIWATAQLFENHLLRTVGPTRWQELFRGKMAFDDPKVTHAAQSYAKILEYQNSDHSALPWSQAIKPLKQAPSPFPPMAVWAHA